MKNLVLIFILIFSLPNLSMAPIQLEIEIENLKNDEGLLFRNKSINLETKYY